MAYEVLQTLIDKQDNSEIIRDQIGVILVEELANQQVLAAAAAKDPTDWEMKVYLERHNPIEDFLNTDPESIDLSDFVPRVNVSIDKADLELAKSDYIEEQGFVGKYLIDVYGFGMAQNQVVGHQPGDEKSAFEAQRAIRLVRNILMASTNIQLQLPTIVCDRMSTQLKFMPMKIEVSTVHQITAGRLTLEVNYREQSPQYQSVPLAQVDVLVCRAEDGSLLQQLTYDQT